MPSEEKQCRICLDGPESEQELGRLIRPCLCKGSISVSSPFENLTESDLEPVCCSMFTSNACTSGEACRRRKVPSLHAPNVIISIVLPELVL